MIKGYKRETDEIHGRCTIPEVRFQGREMRNPAGPEHSADNAECKKCVNREEDTGLVNKSPGLCYCAVFKSGFPAG